MALFVWRKYFRKSARSRHFLFLFRIAGRLNAGAGEFAAAAAAFRATAAAAFALNPVVHRRDHAPQRFGRRPVIVD